MVLTCRPCSRATPTGNKRGTSTTRHLDAETNWPGAELILDCPRDGADENAIGAAATISKQHGATSSTTGSASPPAASGWTSPPAAKNTAAGAMTAARTADDFRRSLANSCLPTASTLRANRGICHEVVTTLSQNSDRFSRSPSRTETSPQVNDLDALTETPADTSDQLPKLNTRVRFPSSAPRIRRSAHIESPRSHDASHSGPSFDRGSATAR